MSREQRFALSALGAIVAITGAWWTLALWPAPTDGADWLLRTRAVCFGSTDTGLPDARGWALLIGQPLGMILVLLAGWGRAAREGLRRLARSGPGRAGLATTTLAVLVAAAGAGLRVSDASAAATLDAPGDREAANAEAARRAAAGARREAREPPSSLALDDHRGRPFSLERLRGRPVLLTFAFAHCETVCPLLVRDVLAAQLRADAAGTGAPRPAVVIVTVDPWRDTPSRLPHLARGWDLPADGFLLGGPVEAVLSELRAWDVPTRRDTLTGQITHPALVYVLDGEGRVAFTAPGGTERLAALLERL